MRKTFSGLSGAVRSNSYLASFLPGLGFFLPWFDRGLRLQALWVFSFLEFSNKKGDVFNILWVLVFGFATINILSLVARRMEPTRNRLSFGETMAIGVVLMSVVLLGYELATMFKIFPLKLHVQ
jgi:hypothetical protein